MAKSRPEPASPTIALAERLKARGLEPLYLIEGKEAFLRSQALEDLRRFAGSHPAITRFEGAEATVASLLDELRTLPFLAPVRIVHVSDADALLLEHADALEKALDEIATLKKTALVLETEGLDGRLRLTKRVRDAAVRVPCDTPDEDGLHRFVEDRVRARGRTLARGAAGALLERFGGGAGVQVDLGILDGEVAKLCSGVPDGGTVTVDQVLALASSLSAEDTFAIVGAIGRGDVRGALEALRGVFRDGAIVDGVRKREGKAIAPMLLGLIAWDVGRIFKARALLDAGRTAQDVIAEAKAWRDRDAFLARVRGSTPETLRRLHALIREADAQLKENGDGFEILTTLVARLALAAPRSRSGSRGPRVPV
jgi:DNA polymerase III delta subunit